jgi:hypothetical protein
LKKIAQQPHCPLWHADFAPVKLNCPRKMSISRSFGSASHITSLPFSKNPSVIALFYPCLRRSVQISDLEGLTFLAGMKENRGMGR